MVELLLSSFGVGLLGSLHCAGMCGPLAVAVSCSRPAEPSGGRLLAFLSGKLGTYVALGVAAGVAGSAVAGLLPCGLVWAMVARSLTVDHPLAGGVVMAAFGLGTSPSLLAAGWVSRAATGRARRWGEAAAAAAVLLMGIVGVWRGVSGLSGGGCPGCHGA